MVRVKKEFLTLIQTTVTFLFCLISRLTYWNHARSIYGNVLVQGVRGVASQVGRRAVLRTRAVADAVVGIAEGAVGDWLVCGGVHAVARDHLREAVVAVEPLRPVGEIHLGSAVRHVVNIAEGMDFATWHGVKVRPGTLHGETFSRCSCGAD